MGRDFLYTLVRDEEHIPTYPVNAYQEIESNSLLGQLQSQILHLENKPLNITKNDRTLTCGFFIRNLIHPLIHR